MKWNPKLYDDKHSFVAEYGKGLLEFVPVIPSMRILDLGCGTGILTQELSKRCGYVLGTDSSIDMITKASKQYGGIDFTVMDALGMSYRAEWDIVFSNAVFHWILDHDLLLENIYKALKPSGQLICEFGAYGNILTIEQGFENAMKKAGYSYHSKFNFTTVETFNLLLEKNGFVVDDIYDYDRSTPLNDGENGLINWIKQFYGSELSPLTEQEQEKVFVEIEEQVKEKLWNGHEWVADYKRLRVIAHK